MRYKVLFFLFIGLFWTMACQAQDQDQALDHFKCYSVKKASRVQSEVVLRDQFTPQNTDPVRVRKARLLCNPVAKRHGDQFFEILDEDHHLAMYPLGRRKDPRRLALVSNQFGEQQELKISQPTLVAVPTKKEAHEAPNGLNHFQCYRATGRRVDAKVLLRDQFQEAEHRVGRPVLFCNPTKKTHDRIETPIENPDAHLTCYNITRTRFRKDIAIANQFGEQKARVAASRLLCAPTRKLDWREVD